MWEIEKSLKTIRSVAMEGREQAIIELHGGAVSNEICPGLLYSAVLSCGDIGQVMSEFCRQ